MARSHGGISVRRLLGFLCFLVAIVLLFLGLSMLGASWMLRPEPLPDGLSWQPPLDQVKNRDLDLATVFLPLTGTSANEVLNESFESGDWENAYALVAYDTTLTDPDRIGALLQLGTRYSAAGKQAQASRCYLAAARIATLSPVLSDVVRLETFLQVSAGLRSAGAPDAARLETDQAFLLAQYSPSLTREPQSRRLAQIASAYDALSANAVADEARALAAEPVAAPADNAGYLPREPFVLPSVDPPASPEVEGAHQRRVAAAKQLQDDIKQGSITRPSDLPSDSVKQLGDALVEEDGARAAFVAPSVQVQEPGATRAILQEQVAWLGLKYRIARGAFGASLVPEWEKQAPAIRTAWNKAWGELFNLYENQANAIPNAQAVSQAVEDVTRQELLAVRWGWYDTSADDLHARLNDQTKQLRDASVLTLRVDTLRVNGKSTDILVPDELLGKNQEALPH